MTPLHQKFSKGWRPGVMNDALAASIGAGPVDKGRPIDGDEVRRWTQGVMNDAPTPRFP